MNRTRAFLLPILALFAAAPAVAQEIIYEVIDVAEAPGADYVTEHASEVYLDEQGANERYVETSRAAVPADELEGTAAYGPFRVLDGGRAALIGMTDERSPAAFAAMLRDHPGIAMLEMIECPGTEDDRANLAVGRMIHARGIATYVPSGGSVRSGGVELFLAGARRSADEGAEFAVHSWADEDGREPADYAADAPENRKYLDYYREMGMTPAEASAFYAMTNSVRHQDAKWLTAADMRQWVRLD